MKDITEITFKKGKIVNIKKTETIADRLGKKNFNTYASHLQKIIKTVSDCINEMDKNNEKHAVFFAITMLSYALCYIAFVSVKGLKTKQLIKKEILEVMEKTLNCFIK